MGASEKGKESRTPQDPSGNGELLTPVQPFSSSVQTWAHPTPMAPPHGARLPTGRFPSPPCLMAVELSVCLACVSLRDQFPAGGHQAVPPFSLRTFQQLGEPRQHRAGAWRSDACVRLHPQRQSFMRS